MFIRKQKPRKAPENHPLLPLPCVGPPDRCHRGISLTPRDKADRHGAGRGRQGKIMDPVLGGGEPSGDPLFRLMSELALRNICGW